jgi:hypothetical protein
MSISLQKVDTDASWTDTRRAAAVRQRESLCTAINLLKYRGMAKIDGCLSLAGLLIHRHQYRKAHLEVIQAITALQEAGEHLERLADQFDEFRDEYTYEPPLVKLGQGQYARYVWGGDQ